MPSRAVPRAPPPLACGPQRGGPGRTGNSPPVSSYPTLPGRPGSLTPAANDHPRVFLQGLASIGTAFRSPAACRSGPGPWRPARCPPARRKERLEAATQALPSRRPGRGQCPAVRSRAAGSASCLQSVRRLASRATHTHPPLPAAPPYLARGPKRSRKALAAGSAAWFPEARPGSRKRPRDPCPPPRGGTSRTAGGPALGDPQPVGRGLGRRVGLTGPTAQDTLPVVLRSDGCFLVWTRKVGGGLRRGLGARGWGAWGWGGVQYRPWAGRLACTKMRANFASQLFALNR